MMNRKLLILGASRYYKKSIEALRSYGYKVYSIDKNPNSPGFDVSDGYSVIDITDEHGAYEYARQMNIDGVLPLNDYAIQTAAYINEKLNLKGIRPNTAKIVTSKARMRYAWEVNGSPIPKYFVSDSLSDAKNKIENLKFPLIVKPTDSRGGGSRGIKAVFEKDKFDEAFEFAQSFYEDKNVVVEEFVTGSEHSIEVLVFDSKAYILSISDKVKTPYPYRVDKQVIYPSALNRDKLNEVQKVVQSAVEGVGIENGAAHIELSMTKDGPILFEIGARPGGGATPIIVEEITGIKYLNLYAKTVFSQKIKEEELLPRFSKSAVYYFFIFDTKQDRVNSICNLNILEECDVVYDYEIFLKEGNVVKEVKIGPDRHGFAVLISDDINEINDCINNIEKKIGII